VEEIEQLDKLLEILKDAKPHLHEVLSSRRPQIIEILESLEDGKQRKAMLALIAIMSETSMRKEFIQSLKEVTKNESNKQGTAV